MFTVELLQYVCIRNNGGKERKRKFLLNISPWLEVTNKEWRIMNDVQLTFQDPLEESPLSSYFLVPLIWRIMEGKDSQTRGREVLILLSLPFPNTQISPY